MTPPPLDPEGGNDHPAFAWCFQKFDAIEQRMAEWERHRDSRFAQIERNRDERFAHIEGLIRERDVRAAERVYLIDRKIDELQGSLTGDLLHPNGLLNDVRQLRTKVTELESDYREFLNRARGFAVGIAAGAGLAGGGVAALILKLFGGGV